MRLFLFEIYLITTIAVMKINISFGLEMFRTGIFDSCSTCVGEITISLNQSVSKRTYPLIKVTNYTGELNLVERHKIS